MKKKLPFLLLIFVFPAGLLHAQWMIKADGGEVLHIQEIQTIFLEKNGSIIAEAVLPVDKRPEVYRDLQISKNDTLLMVNGKRVETIRELENLYKQCRTGDPFKLGLRGRTGLHIVAFNKMAAEQGSNKKMVKVTVSDHDGKMEKQVIDENGQVLRGAEADKFIEEMKKKTAGNEGDSLKVEVEERLP